MPETSTPFDSIESAHEYIGLLCEALDDAHRTIGQEIADPCEFTGARHLDALRHTQRRRSGQGRQGAGARPALRDIG